MLLYPPLDPMPPIPCGLSHPGAWGIQRKHDIHTGIDLYAPHGAPVKAILPGKVEQIEQFTGKAIGMEWWNDTWVVYVRNPSENIIFAYGEVMPLVEEGDYLESGQVLGYVLTVLKEYKGRPMSMLHLEQYHGHKGDTYFRDKDLWWDVWTDPHLPPLGLENPTELLLSIPGSVAQWNDPYRG